MMTLSAARSDTEQRTKIFSKTQTTTPEVKGAQTCPTTSWRSSDNCRWRSWHDFEGMSVTKHRSLLGYLCLRYYSDKHMCLKTGVYSIVIAHEIYYYEHHVC